MEEISVVLWPFTLSFAGEYEIEVDWARNGLADFLRTVSFRNTIELIFSVTAEDVFGRLVLFAECKTLRSA